MLCQLQYKYTSLLNTSLTTNIQKRYQRNQIKEYFTFLNFIQKNKKNKKNINLNYNNNYNYNSLNRLKLSLIPSLNSTYSSYFSSFITKRTFMNSVNNNNNKINNNNNNNNYNNSNLYENITKENIEKSFLEFLTLIHSPKFSNLLPYQDSNSNSPSYSSISNLNGENNSKLNRQKTQKKSNIEDKSNKYSNIASRNIWLSNFNNYNNLPNQQIIHSLDSIEYLNYIKQSQKSHNFDDFNKLLVKTHKYKYAAAVIGVEKLIDFHLPFYESHNKNLISKSLAEHFSNWLFLMDKSIQPQQITLFLTIAFQKICHSDSTSLLNLYQNILSELISLETKKITKEIEEGVTKYILSTFILSAVQCTYNLNLQQLSLQIIQDALKKDYVSCHNIDSHFYGNLVISSTPRNIELTNTKRGRKFSIPLKTIVTPSPLISSTLSSTPLPLPPSLSNPSISHVQSNRLLEALYSIHASGSTHAQILLRDIFYKSLLLCGRPEVLIYFDNLRKLSGLQLSKTTHNRVLEAYATLFDSNGLMTSYLDWINYCRPIGARSNENKSSSYPSLSSLSSSSSSSSSSSLTSSSSSLPSNQGLLSSLNDISLSEIEHLKLNIETLPPDLRTYKLIIDFFSTYPHLATRDMLRILIENLLVDKVLLSELQILKLFHLTKYFKAPVLANNLLRWFCGIDDHNVVQPNQNEVDKTATDLLFYNYLHPLNSIQISKPVLTEIYTIVLDTNCQSVKYREECITIMLEMWRKDIPINKDVMANVMFSLKLTKNYSVLLELFSKMPSLGVGRDNRHVSLAVTALVRTKKLSKSLMMFYTFERAGEKFTDSAYLAFAFRLLRIIRLYPYDESLTIIDDNKKEKTLSLEQTIDICLQLLYYGLHNSKLYAGWSTINFDLTIQTLPEDIYDLFDERIQMKLHSLEETLELFSRQQNKEREDDKSNEIENVHNNNTNNHNDNWNGKESKIQGKRRENKSYRYKTYTISSLFESTSESNLPKKDFKEYEKEYYWLKEFYQNIRKIRNSKGGISAVQKWRRKKIDPLATELSTINYLKSKEE